MLDGLRAFAESDGSTPTAKAWDDQREHRPSASTIRIRFGSWNAALQQAGLATATWSDDDLLQSLRDFAATQGHPPTVEEWNALPGTNPAYTTITRRFGSWHEGLRKAGLRAALDWSDDEILASLRDYAREQGRTPTRDEWRGLPNEYPAPTTVVNRFGGWNKALDAAGLKPAARTSTAYWTKHHVMEALIRDTLRRGHAPTVAEWRSEDKLPSPAVIFREFDTWNEALAAAGIEGRPEGGAPQTWTDPQIFAALRADTKERGHPASPTEWRRERKADAPSYHTLRDRFGTFRAAFEAAGIQERSPDRKIRWTADRIILALRAEADRAGDPPKAEHWRKANGDHPSSATVRKMFGSWQGGLKAAGLLSDQDATELKREVELLRAELARVQTTE